ncbi:RxLR effector protein [Phytophthora megakarya]|uniref:RxLR effector protein n=1 Tax=Phytophthora megakarya TaxID=4795 RepID=A0A225WDN7_9STRA|nr:RxLR effector protein [Phytophthora megakarya]
MLPYFQNQLRQEIYNNINADTGQLQTTQNKLLHAIRKRCLEHANQALDHQDEVIESLSTSSRVFEATQHFRSLFVNPSREQVVADSDCRPLQLPIDPTELRRAFHQLKNGHATSPDDIAAELLNLLICLSKPNKPRSNCASLRPISLLNCIPTDLSGVVLRRISGKVATFLSPHQSNFRPGRSTADAVWAHRWIVARTQRYRKVYHLLNIDLSRAFDSIDRAKLVAVLRTFLDDDEVRLVQLLLADTTLSLRSGLATLNPVTNSLGTAQGDSLSRVLFIVYLEAALRDLTRSLDVGRTFLNDMIIYSDDADFVCRTLEATTSKTRLPRF